MNKKLVPGAPICRYCAENSCGPEHERWDDECTGNEAVDTAEKNQSNKNVFFEISHLECPVKIKCGEMFKLLSTIHMYLIIDNVTNII